jgi:mRNA-degrading endonuclease RelE of RelBE toxin-antitoxin system
MTSPTPDYGDYRIIHKLDLARNELFLVTLGHRRDVYRF